MGSMNQAVNKRDLTWLKDLTFTDEEYQALIDSGEILSEEEYNSVSSKINDRRKARGLKKNEKDDWKASDYKNFEDGKYYIADDLFDCYINTRYYNKAKAAEMAKESKQSAANTPVVDTPVDEKFNETDDPILFIMDNSDVVIKNFESEGVKCDKQLVDKYFEQLRVVSDNADISDEDRSDENVKAEQMAIMAASIDKYNAECEKIADQGDREHKIDSNLLAWAQAVENYEVYEYEKAIDTYVYELHELYNSQDMREHVNAVKQAHNEDLKDIPFDEDAVRAEYVKGYIGKSLVAANYDENSVQAKMWNEAYERFSNDLVEAKKKDQLKYDEIKKHLEDIKGDEPYKRACKNRASKMMSIAGMGFMAKSAIKGSRLKHKEANLKKQIKGVHEQEKNLRDKMQSPKGFGDVFANAFSKAMLELDSKDLDKKYEKVQKRIKRHVEKSNQLRSLVGLGEKMAHMQSDREIATHFHENAAANHDFNKLTANIPNQVVDKSNKNSETVVSALPNVKTTDQPGTEVENEAENSGV